MKNALWKLNKKITWQPAFFLSELAWCKLCICMSPLIEGINCGSDRIAIGNRPKPQRAPNAEDFLRNFTGSDFNGLKRKIYLAWGINVVKYFFIPKICYFSMLLLCIRAFFAHSAPVVWLESSHIKRLRSATVCFTFTLS